MPRKQREVPHVSVLERRLAHPFGAPSVPITLKDGQRWAIRIVNDGVRTGRVHQATQLGWAFVSPEEVDGSPASFGFRVLDGRLVRGEHGEEVLVKMPQADFDQIQQAKSDHNLKQMRGSKTAEAAAQATAKKFGDEAGDTVYRSGMDVQDSRVSMDLEGEGPPS